MEIKNYEEMYKNIMRWFDEKEKGTATEIARELPYERNSIIEMLERMYKFGYVGQELTSTKTEEYIWCKSYD